MTIRTTSQRAIVSARKVPFYFEPCVLSGPGPKQRSTIVDGGVLSNFAVDIFDRRDGAPARWPTFGVRIIPDLPAGLGDLFPLLKYQPLPALKILQDVVTTALVGHDQTQLDRPEIRARTIAVESPGVSITDFGLPPAGQRELTQRGGGRRLSHALAGGRDGMTTTKMRARTPLSPAEVIGPVTDFRRRSGR
jgi:NTE family protein